ncbi:protein-tyrosine sulfotransferase [Phoenix dactylifera]|uniref:Protein-tyrosine sulfotransferase n=1 Tax=Phoenix dactylifera TaxID=42345 RepID=A0A8B8ZA58_PHODC|nr:protein-tyrosine sulfotransferase [Phoenix dactylifera]
MPLAGQRCASPCVRNHNNGNRSSLFPLFQSGIDCCMRRGYPGRGGGGIGCWFLRLLCPRAPCLPDFDHAARIYEHEVSRSEADIAGPGRMGMAWTYRFAMLLIFLSLVSTLSPVSSNGNDYFHCESIVRNWADFSSESGIREDKSTLKDLLFFLHVPRTGGRTYFHCFLRKLYTSAQECPRSYDKLRFDPSKPNCRLMVTHDDYSLMSKLPKDRTSVVTILRNPIDRVFSTYEFSVEVAARFLVHPNLTSATQMSGRLRPKTRGVSTLDIWPWKYLVPWMREDLFIRRDARKLGKFRELSEAHDSYNMEDMVMPLHEFINDPLAHEIIHNGATFQVAGLTNNSCLTKSHKVRRCVRKHPELGHFVLEVAKSRLDHMLYIGLTEDHKKSATMFANMVGAQVLSQSEALNSNMEQEASNTTELSSAFPDPETDGSNQVQHSTNSQHEGKVPSPSDVEPAKENMTVGKLMEAYEACISTLRKSQANRRTMSLKRIAPANFSKEARLLVPETVVQQILSLNSLDVELYKHAQEIFMQQQKHLTQSAPEIFMQRQGQPMAEGEQQKNMHDILYGCSPWRIVLLAVAVLLVVVLVVLVVSTRGRTSKLKV